MLSTRTAVGSIGILASHEPLLGDARTDRAAAVPLRERHRALRAGRGLHAVRGEPRAGAGRGGARARRGSTARALQTRLWSRARAPSAPTRAPRSRRARSATSAATRLPRGRGVGRGSSARPRAAHGRVRALSAPAVNSLRRLMSATTRANRGHRHRLRRAGHRGRLRGARQRRLVRRHRRREDRAPAARRGADLRAGPGGAARAQRRPPALLHRRRRRARARAAAVRRRRHAADLLRRRRPVRGPRRRRRDPGLAGTTRW